MKLSRILHEEGLTRRSSAEYRDSEYNLLSDAQVEAIRANDPLAAAKLLDDAVGDLAYLHAEAWGKVIAQIFQETGQTGVLEFRDNLEDALYRARKVRNMAEIAASPYRKELEALKNVYDFSITPTDVKYIRYQPKKKGGIFTGAILEDMDGRLGNVRYSIGEEQCRRAGTTLLETFRAMEAMGAKLVMKGMGPGGKKPWVDYDGWAY